MFSRLLSHIPQDRRAVLLHIAAPSKQSSTPSPIDLFPAPTELATEHVFVGPVALAHAILPASPQACPCSPGTNPTAAFAFARRACATLVVAVPRPPRIAGRRSLCDGRGILHIVGCGFCLQGWGGIPINSTVPECSIGSVHRDHCLLYVNRSRAANRPFFPVPLTRIRGGESAFTLTPAWAWDFLVPS